jgi:hypothetical protein
MMAADSTVDLAHIVELQAGEEVNEQKVSAVSPVSRYYIHLRRRTQVTVELRENNTASRCVLYLSSSDASPTANNAMWSAESSSPRKSIVILPIDSRFTEGPCFVVVRYNAGSGAVFFSLRVSMVEQYDAVWPFPKSLAVYSGHWQLHYRNGQGKCVYFATYEEFEAYTRNSPSVVAGDLSAASVATLTRTLLLQAASVRQQQSSGSYMPGSVGGSNPTSPVKAGEAAPKEEGSDSAFFVPDGGVELYDGEWRLGEKDGQGTYTWKGTKQYNGHWRGGKRNGKGDLTKKDGSVFSGEWREDAKHGFGVQQYSNGTRFEGEWLRNKRHGSGTFFYDDGTKIVGEWQDDILVSDVEAVYASGEVYKGGWQNDARHGQGNFRDTRGLVHEGAFVNNMKHGAGVWYLPRSVQLRGEWCDDKRVEDTGEFVFPSTDVYCGQWDEQRHVRQGAGTCRYENGDVYHGQWSDDERCGGGTLSYANGNVFEGVFTSNVRHGDGKFTTTDPASGAVTTYDGEWSRDMRHGSGRCNFPDGSVYDGEWSQDNRCGDGQMESTDGGWSYEGQWSEDTRNGEGTMTINVARMQAWQGKQQTNANGASMVADVPPPESGTSRSVATTINPHAPSENGPPSQASEEDAVETYSGSWRDGRRHGEGTVSYSTGDSYTGGWRNNDRTDGKGTCRYANGDVYDGQWRHEQRHGRGICSYADGMRYDGEWSHDMPAGQGALHLPNSDIFYGTWDSTGKRADGYGKCVFSNGDNYEGEWKDEVPHGRGVLTYLDGTAFDGNFDKGEYRL